MCLCRAALAGRLSTVRVMADSIAEGVPVAAGADGVAIGVRSPSRGNLYTMANMTVYVVPQRDPMCFDGRALLLLPDMTGTVNEQNQMLAGEQQLRVTTH